jgi:hypothetical protein
LNLWQEFTSPQSPALWDRRDFLDPFDSIERTAVGRTNVDTRPPAWLGSSQNLRRRDFVTCAGTARWDIFSGSSQTSRAQSEVFSSDDLLKYLLPVADTNQTALTPYLSPSDSDAPLRLLDRFERGLADWSGYLNPRHVASITRSISQLLPDEEAINEEGEKPSYDSFVEMLKFLTAHAWATAPMVTIDRRGFLAVLWRARGSEEADLILTFVGDGTIKWHVYDARRPKLKPFVASGTSEIQDEIQDVWNDVPQRVKTERWLSP